MTPQQKADYYLKIFNGDFNACLRLCDKMIETGLVTSYYEKVKEIILETKNNN